MTDSDDSDLLKLPAEIAERAASANLPDNYVSAKRALAKCVDIDVCSMWADKMAALASYARQAGDREMENCAKRIRLRAVRRCGELLLTYDARGGDKSKVVALLDFAPPSRAEAAKDAGLSPHQSRVATKIARVPAETFDEVVESASPPGTETLAKVTYLPTPDGWTRLPNGELAELKSCSGSITNEVYDEDSRETLLKAIEQLRDIESTFRGFRSENYEIQRAVAGARRRLENVVRKIGA